MWEAILVKNYVGFYSWNKKKSSCFVFRKQTLQFLWIPPWEPSGTKLVILSRWKGHLFSALSITMTPANHRGLVSII